MIKLETIGKINFEGAIKGMRNPYKSREKCDSTFRNGFAFIGPNDMKLAKTLALSDKRSDGKFLRMIHVQVDINAPLYWWKEMDQYKVATTTNSESTMHTIHTRRFDVSDFSMEKITEPLNAEENKVSGGVLEDYIHETITFLNDLRDLYLETKDKIYWYQIIQILPESYNQLRTWDGDYQTLQSIYIDRKNHKLDEWTEFRRWIESLPYSELITGVDTNG